MELLTADESGGSENAENIIATLLIIVVGLTFIINLRIP